MADAASPLLLTLESGRRRRSDDHSFVGRDEVVIPVSYTATPIRSQGQVIGAVLVFRDVLAVKRSERMQRFLAQMSAALGSSLDYKTTCASLVRCIVPTLADLCLFDEVGPSGERTRALVHFADATRDESPNAHRLSLIPALDGRTPPARTPVLVEMLSANTSELDLWSARDAAVLRQLGATSMIAVPLTSRGRSLGALTFALAESGRRYSRSDLVFAQEIADRAASAIDNARSHRATEEAVRQRQDILAVVSHDLRAPLNTVLIAASSLLGRPDHDASDRRKLEMIVRAGQRMARMTSDLLDLSSIEAGHLSVSTHATDIGSLVEDVVQAETHIVAARALRLEVLLGEGDLVASCDRDRILQVFNNLVSNAAKFTPAGGQITIRVERRAGEVYCEVSDTGRGIAHDLLPRLFTRYLQAPDTAAEGRGLGLFISKGIIEAHGGILGVRSVEKEGTTFFFNLPRAKEATCGAPRAASELS